MSCPIKNIRILTIPGTKPSSWIMLKLTKN